jgi:uncharacterized protein (TIRG00374 family)
MIKRINSKIKRIDIYEVINNLSFSKNVMIKAIIISLIAWILTYTLMFYCFDVFNINILFSDILILSPILTLARLFPLTLNGIGSDEAVIIYLFSSFSNESSILLIAALFYRLALMILPAIPGIIVIIISKSKRN